MSYNFTFYVMEFSLIVDILVKKNTRAIFCIHFERRWVFIQISHGMYVIRHYTCIQAKTRANRISPWNCYSQEGKSDLFHKRFKVKVSITLRLLLAFHYECMHWKNAEYGKKVIPTHTYTTHRFPQRMASILIGTCLLRSSSCFRANRFMKIHGSMCGHVQLRVV